MGRWERLGRGEGRGIQLLFSMTMHTYFKKNPDKFKITVSH